jgi:tRNA G10  N-methylase Trm11
MLLFILGRQPEIGIAELRAVYGNAEFVLPQVALVSTDEMPDIDRLGGVRKVGHVIWDKSGDAGSFLLEKLKSLPEGKITLGISQYGKTASVSSANKTAMFLKKNLDRSVRVLPNNEADISDAATLGNKLGSSPNKVELLMIYVGNRLIVAILDGVQDLNSYTFRDRSRPKRDARVGMLPPKLAQTMINLAYGASKITSSAEPSNFPDNFSKDFSSHASTSSSPHGASEKNSRKLYSENLLGKAEKVILRPILLDPFCGTGVVLQEAELMGFSVYGTDIEPRMVEYTGANLEWLESKYHMDSATNAQNDSAGSENDNVNVKLEVGDATNHTWTAPIDIVATETYLGQPYTTAPNPEKLQQNIATCNTIVSKFLTNLAPQITPDTGLCVAVPRWFLNKQTYRLPLTRQLAELGYEQISYSDNQVPIIYHREDQIVGRELLVLRKKSN